MKLIRNAKIFLLSFFTLLFIGIVSVQNVSAETIADQVEYTFVTNEYDSFSIKAIEPSVMKVVLPEEGIFKLDLNPIYIYSFVGYIYDEMGNELSYYSNSGRSYTSITPELFGYKGNLPAGTYYLKYWSSYNGSYDSYGDGEEFTYYGSFIPSKTPSIEIALTVNKGKTIQLDTDISYSSDNKITWKSSNNKVATVSSSGVVKGIKKGTVTIKAYTNSGLLAKITVKVKN